MSKKPNKIQKDDESFFGCCGFGSTNSKMVIDPKKEHLQIPLAQISKEVIVNIKPHESPTSSSVSTDNNVSDQIQKTTTPQIQINPNKLSFKQSTDQILTPPIVKERPSSIHRRIFSDGTTQPNDVINGAMKHNRDQEDVSEVDTGNATTGHRGHNSIRCSSMDMSHAKLDTIINAENVGGSVPKSNSNASKLPRPLAALAVQSSEDINSFKTTSSTTTLMLTGSTCVFPHTNCMLEVTGVSLEDPSGNREKAAASALLSSEDVANHGDQHLERLDVVLQGLLYERGDVLRHKSDWAVGRISIKSVNVTMVFSEVKQLKKRPLEAVPVLQQLLSHLSSLTTTTSDSNRWFLLQRARCERRLGALLKSAGEYKGAEMHVRNYLAALQRLGFDSTEPERSGGLALLASILSLLKRPLEAVEADRQALELATVVTRR